MRAPLCLLTSAPTTHLPPGRGRRTWIYALTAFRICLAETPCVRTSSSLNFL